MRKERTLLILGIWVAVLPYLGFPSNWRDILFVITGVALVYLAYLFYLEVKVRIAKVDTRSKTFLDNTDNKE